MRSLPVLEQAWLAMEDGVIVDFGTMDTFPGIAIGADWGWWIAKANTRCLLGATATPTGVCGQPFRRILGHLEGKSYQKLRGGGGILNRPVPAGDVRSRGCSPMPATIAAGDEPARGPSKSKADTD